MKFTKTEDGYIIRLIKGERIVESLSAFFEKQNIKSGVFQGIGGASDITLGYYNLRSKVYEWKNFSPIHEIVSLSGNLAKVDDKPFLHIHMIISNNNFETFGGHLKEATVGATCELYLTNFEISIERVLDEETGLKLLSCEQD